MTKAPRPMAGGPVRRSRCHPDGGPRAALLPLLPKQVIERDRGAPPLGIEGMGVEARGERGVAMACPVGNGSNVDAVGNEQGEVHVPRIVQPCPRRVHSLLERVPDLPHVAGIQRRTEAVGEHASRNLIVGQAKFSELGSLSDGVLRQDVAGRGVDGNDTPATGGRGLTLDNLISGVSMAISSTTCRPPPAAWATLWNTQNWMGWQMTQLAHTVLRVPDEL